MTEPSDGQGASKKSWLVPVLIGLGLAFMMVAVLAGIAMSGWRTYMSRAKQAEAMNQTRVLAATVIACSEQGLPPSSTPVPPTPPAGGKHQSAAADWAQPAFACEAAPITLAQYFSYQWLQTSDTTGRVVARGDLDGDGVAECEVKVEISCEPTGCVATAPAVACP